MNKEHGHWAKFSDCCKDVPYASDFLATAQRFYLPNGREVIEGLGQVDENIKELIRLPFDSVALLYEHEMHYEPSLWFISAAFDPHGETNRRMHFVPVEKIGERKGFCFTLFVGYRGKWTLGRIMYFVELSDDKTGVTLQVLNELEQGMDVVQFHDKGCADAVPLFNLCALLNIEKTKTHCVVAPNRLNAKREKRGNLPLYDYHILEVGGERWDSPYTTTNDGSGMRSHLRRLHIRRFDNGKWTWVRATFVRGSVPGFVDKDYRV